MALAPALVACGDSGVAEGDIGTVLDAKEAIASGSGGARSGAVQDLIRVCQEDPDAELDGETMRQIVTNAADALRASGNSSASSDLADELEAAASDGCE